MGCTRNRSKIWDNCLRVIVLSGCLLSPSSLWAAFASQFSLLVGEQYSDNIFFSKDKEHDFVSIVTPTLTLLYAPPGQVAPTLNLNISSSGELYARHSDLNNFGDNININGGYTYQYSPRLNFYLSNVLQRQGPTRLGGLGGFGFPSGPTSPPPVGGTPPPSSSQNLKDLISAGDQLSNSFSLQGSFLYRPDISFNAGYTNTFTKFIDAGGTDVFHTLNVRGVYNWRQDHNLHAGYSISISKSRNGESGVIHNFDVGDDYFTNYNLQLTPTLSLAASTGLSLNTGSDGPRIANNTSITITKLWQTAELNAGMRKGLTPSFGVAGISDTTSFFTNYNLRLSEKLSTNANANFSFFDTEDVNFKTFQAGLGLQYLFTSWLSSGLNYYFNWRDSGAGANSTDLLEKGVVKSNNVFLSVTMRFDLWPNTGLARTMSATSLTPTIRPPFPNPTAPQSTSPFPPKSP
jgi:hypothetical protein